eukprot:s2344_g2.t1
MRMGAAWHCWRQPPADMQQRCMKQNVDLEFWGVVVMDIPCCLYVQLKIFKKIIIIYLTPPQPTANLGCPTVVTAWFRPRRCRHFTAAATRGLGAAGRHGAQKNGAASCVNFNRRHGLHGKCRCQASSVGSPNRCGRLCGPWEPATTAPHADAGGITSLNAESRPPPSVTWMHRQVADLLRPKTLGLSVYPFVFFFAMGIAGFLLSWLWSFTLVDAFKLLDVGPPRTGTQSMYEVMKILGLNPLHTGYTLSVRPALCGYLFADGSLDDALAVFDGYDAAMDEPVMLLYEEIMAAFPGAKFLLTISDPESWFTNYIELANLLHDSWNSTERKVWDSFPENCSAMQSWGCHFLRKPSPTPEEKDLCLQNYARHIQRVQDIIPPERLLVYNWSDGWSPLSHFLGTGIPEEEFPHRDTAKTNSIEKVKEKLGVTHAS